MTKERHQSYKRVLHMIDRLGPSKLQDDEEATLRDLAEGLLLAIDEKVAEEMIEESRTLIQGLVESGRWLSESAAELSRDIEACWKEPVSA